jgi:hypothetical protein
VRPGGKLAIEPNDSRPFCLQDGIFHEIAGVKNALSMMFTGV